MPSILVPRMRASPQTQQTSTKGESPEFLCSQNHHLGAFQISGKGQLSLSWRDSVPLSPRRWGVGGAWWGLASVT